MNPDIRVQTTFPHHHKTKKLRRRLGAEGVMSLVFLWVFAAENRPDGVLSGMDPDDIAIACQWDGDATSMLQAMLEVGFLELAEGVYVLHDWVDNNPWAAAAPARKAKASAAARARWEKRNEIADAPGMGGDAPSMPGDASGNAPSPNPSPSPSPTPKPEAARASGQAGVVVTRSEQMIRDCFAAKADVIASLFPNLNIPLECEECVAKYGGQSIGADPWLIVLRWLKNSQEVADGRGRSRNDGAAAAAAGAAAAGTDDDLTEEFCRRPGPAQSV